jgi:hypothetical protein
MTRKKKTVLLITGISLLFLLTPVGLSLLLQLPGVQNFIVHKTIDVVNKRIQGNIALSRIGIAMPGSIVLENLFIRDHTNDTIAYVSKARVRLKLIGLLQGKVHIRSIRLSDCNVMIRRVDGDQKFNIENLFFAKTAPGKKSRGKKAGGRKISLDAKRVHCKNVRFTFDDRKSGVQVETRAGRLAIRMNRLKLDQLQFDVNDLKLDSSFCAVRIFKKGPPKKKSKRVVNLPQITVKTLAVANAVFTFKDTVAKTSIGVDAGRINIEKGDVDLNAEVISAHSVFITDAGVGLGLTVHAARPHPADTAVPMHKRARGNRWRISAGHLDLGESRFDLDLLNKPRQQTGFDAAHMHFRGIAVQAADAFYSARAIRAKLAHAAALDSNTTDLKKCAVDFTMDEQGISAQNLYLKTLSSDIRASFTTGFSPFNKKIRDSLPDLPIRSVFTPSSVSTQEIRLFFPALALTPLFKGDDKIIRFSGKIEGPVKALKGDKINVSYGEITDLRTNFLISRLPDVKNTLFDIPALTLTTGRDDVASLLGKGIIPQGLSIPSRVRLEASFRGTMHAFRSTLRASLDNSTVSADVALDSMRRYAGAITVNDLNPGLLFPDAKKIGRMTLSATIDGRGFDPEKLSAHITMDAPSAYLNGYTYHNIKLEARADSQRYQGTLSVKDENVSLALEGDVKTAKDREALRFKLDLQGADFRKLQLLKDSLAVSAGIEADLTGRNLNTLSGMLNMTGMTLTKNGIDYHLDSLRCAIATTPQSQTLSIRSSILDAQYDGAMPLDRAFKEFGRQVLGCLPLKQSAPDTAPDLHDMSLRITVRDHPLLNGLLLPKLTQVEGVTIQADYSEADKKLKADAGVQRGEFNGISFTGAHWTLTSLDNSLSCLLTADEIANAQAAFTNVEVWGVSRKDRATVSVSTVGKNQDTALYAALSLKTSDSGIALALDPARFYLGGYPWTVKKNNSVLIKGKRIAIRDLGLSRNRSSIAIASVAAADSDVISIAVRDFALKFISQMLHMDSSFVDGTLSGNIDMIRQGGQSALKASAGLRDIMVHNVKIGSLTLAVENPEKRKYGVTADLTGQGNDAHIKGSINAVPGERNIDINANIKNLTLQTIEPFTAKAISGSRGYLKGDFTCKIAGNRPIMSGKLFFNDASFKPAALNSTIRLGNEPIAIQKSGFYFNNFSIKDRQNHMARVSGGVTMDSAGLFRFDLDANAGNFLLLNTTGRDNPVFYGRLIVDWKAAINGTSRFPVIDSRIALKAPSSLTFAVPETKAKMDRGENVVIFSGPAEQPAGDKSTDGRWKNTGTFKGIELSSEIKVDKGVTLRLVPDPSTLDFLVVRGDGALNLGMEKNGAINLTGTYRLSDGSYTVTLPPLLAKKFTIRSGSTLTWNGNPTDANAAIVAQYAVSAAPIDLVYAVSEAQKSSYQKPLKFLVTLNLNGPLLKPDISFALDLAPADKGALEGRIDEKLSQINLDPTALNKQVFALLVLGKFLPDNILDQSSGNNQLASVARSSVSGFLTAQLNQWGASLLPGVELNVGVQSYDSDTSGLAAGKTMVDLGVRKQLFNDRLSVEVGGTFDVEGGSNGAKETQNMAKDIGGNVAIEYKLTRNGRYSLKGFRHTQYEGALDGQITETGAGLVYSRNFNFWRQLFKRSRKGNDEQ